MNLKRIIIISLIIKLLIIPFFFHPDILWIYNSSSKLVSLKIFNIYKFEYQIKEVLFKYPPLSYFFFGFYLFIIKPFVHLETLTSDWNLWVDNLYIYRQLFLFKIPYLIFDYFILLYLIKIDKINLTRYLIWWTFNPLVIYVIYIYGQFDVIPLFFILLAYYLFLQKKNFYSVFVLSIAISFKIFPLLLLPFFVLFISNSIKDFIKFFCAGISLFIISILPFINSKPFFNNVLKYSENYLTNEGIIFQNSNKISILFFIFYSLIFFTVLHFKKIKEKKENLLNVILIIFLSYYLLYNFNPQFCIWIFPFLILYHFKQNKISTFFLLFIIFYFINNFLSYGRNAFSIHFVVINKILYGLPSPAMIIDYLIGLTNYLKFTNSVFTAILIFYLFINLSELITNKH
ncbi:MAG TPA: glycosyltransferase 87 family protein [bacterium]|nr:glycosyltransferase 87 family protein [bacterium]